MLGDEMYLQHSVHIDRPLAQCSKALQDGPRTWFPKLRADHSTEVGMRLAGVTVSKTVSVDLGVPAAHGDWVSLPMTWRATFPEKLFPVMFGKLELAPVDDKVTRLTVSGMYEPPLGRIGALANEAIMHSVAESTIRELTEGIAKNLGATA